MAKKKMTAEQMLAKVEAIDWSRLLDKFPQLVALVLQMIDLFKQQPMYSAGNKCSAECRDCLNEQRASILASLMHNAHLLNCCEEA